MYSNRNYEQTHWKLQVACYATYATMIPAECEEIGFTSSGYYDIFKTETGAGFFSAGATINLK